MRLVRISPVRPKTLCSVFLVLAFPCTLFASVSAAQQAAAPAPDYNALGRTAVTEFAARQFDKVFAQAGAKMAASISTNNLAQIWDQVLAQSGPFQKIISSRVVEYSGFHNTVVACAFQKAELRIILSFDDAGHIVGLHFAPAEESAPGSAQPWNPPPYADQAKFHEDPLTVSDGRWQLPGTLTLPDGKGPFTAIVLISGSGPNDADETIGANKVLKDLAWGLATQGFAVLRYPKRTHVYGARSAADPLGLTVKDEYLDDAHAAIVLLASRPEINPKRIFLAGHSEGGYLAPRIAEANPQLAGIIILEGETRSLERLMIAQLEYEASLRGPNASQIEAVIPEARNEAAAMESPDLKPGTVVPLVGIQFPSSYILDLRSYDPCAVAASLKIPIYITQGGRDYQVTTTDFAGWQKALAGHPNATLKLYPSLDHPLFSGTRPSKPEEYVVPGQHVAPEVITDLAAWINSH